MGLQIMRRGRAIELLEHVKDTADGQVWLVKPLFVIAPVEEVTIRSTDICRPLHTERKAA